MQDVHGVLAVLACGVDVAADVEAVLGDVVAGQAPGDFLLGFRGRTPRSLMLFVGQMLVSSANRSTSLRRSRQNSSSSRPGRCFVLFFGPGTRGTPTTPRRLDVDPAAKSASIDQAGADDAYYKWLVVNLVGSDDPAAVSAATASHRITSRCRPMFLVNSINELVPATEVYVVAGALAASGVAAQTLLLPGSRHAEGYLRDAIAPTLTFIAGQLSTDVA